MDKDDDNEKLIRALTPFDHKLSAEEKQKHLKEIPENLYELVQRIITFYSYFHCIQLIRDLSKKHDVDSPLLNDYFYNIQNYLCINSIIIELGKLFQNDTDKYKKLSFRKVIGFLSQEERRKPLLETLENLRTLANEFKDLRDTIIAHNQSNMSSTSVNMDKIHELIVGCFHLFLGILKEADQQTKTIMVTNGLWSHFEDHFIVNIDHLFLPFLPNEINCDYKKAMAEKFKPFKYKRLSNKSIKDSIKH